MSKRKSLFCGYAIKQGVYKFHADHGLFSLYRKSLPKIAAADKSFVPGVSGAPGVPGCVGRIGLYWACRAYRAVPDYTGLCQTIPGVPGCAGAPGRVQNGARQTKKHPPRIARGGCRPCFSFLRRASAAHCGACGANCPSSGASPDAASASSPTSSSAPSLMRLSRARPDATSSSPSTTV